MRSTFCRLRKQPYHSSSKAAPFPLLADRYLFVFVNSKAVRGGASDTEGSELLLLFPIVFTETKD